MIIINSKTTYIPIEIENVPNGVCPNCHINGKLDMTFYQVHVDSGFIKKLTKKITASLYCTACNNEIPSVKWSHPLENYFKTRKSKIQIQKPYSTHSFVFKLMIGFLILFFCVCIFGLIFLYMDNQKKINMSKNPEIGDLYYIHYMFRKSDSEYDTQGFTWARVNQIKEDTLYVQFNKNRNLQPNEKPDLSLQNFDSEEFKMDKNVLADKKQLKSFPNKAKGFEEFSSYIYEFKKQ